MGLGELTLRACRFTEVPARAAPRPRHGLRPLLARRETRFFGLTVLGFYGARVVARALWTYTLGLGRPDICLVRQPQARHMSTRASA